MKTAIMYGALGRDDRPDLADSLVQAETAARVLTGLDCQVRQLTMDLDSSVTARRLMELRPDLVINLVDEIQGRGDVLHLAPALLEQLGLAYTGSDSWALYATSNKPLAKRLMADAGLPTPAWITARGSGNIEECREPMIIKSVWDHGSVGLDDDCLVGFSGKDRIQALLQSRVGAWFAETYIPGREFNVALLQDKGQVLTLPIAEIDFLDYAPDKPRVVGYRAKWEAGSFEYHHTPRRFDHRLEDRPLLDQLAGLARQCWDLFELKGYARVDFRVDEQGRPWILEVNANPCLSPDAGFAAAARECGIGLEGAMERIVCSALADASGQTGPQRTRAGLEWPPEQVEDWGYVGSISIN